MRALHRSHQGGGAAPLGALKGFKTKKRGGKRDYATFHRVDTASMRELMRRLNAEAKTLSYSDQF